MQKKNFLFRVGRGLSSPLRDSEQPTAACWSDSIHVSAEQPTTKAPQKQSSEAWATISVSIWSTVLVVAALIWTEAKEHTQSWRRENKGQTPIAPPAQTSLVL